MTSFLVQHERPSWFATCGHPNRVQQGGFRSITHARTRRNIAEQFNTTFVCLQEGEGQGLYGQLARIESARSLVLQL